MKDVIVIGASGHAKVVRDIIIASGDNFLGYLDDDPNKDTLGKIEDYQNFEAEFVIAIGNSEVREEISKKLSCAWYTAIHPTAVISPSATIQEGTVVMPLAVIQADSQIGKHCIINSQATIEHDNQIGDYSHISVGANLGGTVSIGEHVWVGIGATIKNNQTVCANTMIGAGAVVVDDIKESGTYVGVPAKKK